MLIFRTIIALSAVNCTILIIISLTMELWLLRNVGFYRSFLVLCFKKSHSINCEEKKNKTLNSLLYVT